jgi:hypothetical protein
MHQRFLNQGQLGRVPRNQRIRFLDLSANPYDRILKSAIEYLNI